MWTRDRIERMAAELGFEVGFARVREAPHADRVRAWVEAGLHADLSWMPETLEVRLDPRVRMPDARTVIVFRLGHAWRRPPKPSGRVGRVARYAWGRDYHNLMGKRLNRMKRALRADGVGVFGDPDTAPILERSWAVDAGLGVLGKNTLVFQPGRTSWQFLACLVVDLDLEPDSPIAKDACGSCIRCLTVCPTQAFVGPYRLDAGRCISYWTIEARTPAPVELRAGFGDWVFGCDLCQEVCPHNHHPPDPTEPDFLPKHAWLDLDEVLHTEDDVLMERFRGTPLRRPKAAGLKRNAAIALANLGDPEGAHALEVAADHPDPQVHETAAWALRQLHSAGGLPVGP